MIPSFVLSLREGLEAALIIGIVLGALRRTGRNDLLRYLWMGVICAIAISLLAALLLLGIGAGLEGRPEQIFEGLTLLLAAGVLTWMIFWVSKQSRSMADELDHNVSKAVNLNGRWAIFFLAFIAVFREGVELVLYLTAIAMTSGGTQILVGMSAGFFVAGLLGYLIYTATLKLDLKHFFHFTTFLLILFAAGLIAHSVAEFNEAGIIPTMINPVWDLNPLLSDQSGLGVILSTLFGYYGSPSLSQVLGYSLYLVGIILLIVKTRKLQPN